MNQRIAMCLARAAATAPLRQIDAACPVTWEFSAFSQNGEDGIIDYLARHLTHSDRTFLEIGAADGLENLTAWLALGLHYSGLMIEGDTGLCQRAALVYPAMNLGVKIRQMFVDQENVRAIAAELGMQSPDVFSLDIDGMDYYVARSLLESGVRPKIIVVEYNAIFGAENSVTVPYSASFERLGAHPSHLYYGVSVAGWRKFLATHGYDFITVDQNGVNAFFVRTDVFPPGFGARMRGATFRENYSQLAEHGTGLDIIRRQILALPLASI